MPNHNHVWKRRIRNAPSATRDDREIVLSLHWSTKGNDPALPTTAMRKDPLLWSIWTMKTELAYMVKIKVGALTDDSRTKDFTSEKEALAYYKKLVKEFPRSKEVDYGFPLDDTISG